MLLSNIIFVLLVYFTDFSFQCIGLGCVGFGGCGSACLFGLCLQTPLIQPMGCPCGIGFSCMRGGCVRRAMASGAKTFHDEPVLAIESAVNGLEKPDEHFRACCEMLGISEGCANMCHYANVSVEMIEMTTVAQLSCASKDVENIVFCAARGGNHTSCCNMLQVPHQCTSFCDQSSTEQTSPLFANLMCVPYFDKIWECFSEAAKTDYYEANDRNMLSTTRNLINRN